MTRRRKNQQRTNKHRKKDKCLIKMSRVLDDRETSLILSECLNVIGVNEQIVQIRRQYSMKKEAMGYVIDRFTYNDDTLYLFGSQSEGSTTQDLESDNDWLQCSKEGNVIQDVSEWKPGVMNLLMVQDDRTSPGYCLLQLLKVDEPVPETDVLCDVFRMDNNGRILTKNTCFHRNFAGTIFCQNGPAFSTAGTPELSEIDYVQAFTCESWPNEGGEWLDRRCIGNWPSIELKQSAMSKGCFLVPVASKLNDLDDVEWRISTSMAERLMMFDLNITKMKCYVMLKLIRKTFLAMNGEIALSSFMCKCTLFHCIENTPEHYWREENLFPCLMECIRTLHNRVEKLYCPHYIIVTNNLMTQRINYKQQKHLLKTLRKLVEIDMFFDIKIDNFGDILKAKLTNFQLQRYIPSLLDIKGRIVSNARYFFNKSRLTILVELSNKRLLEVAFILAKGIKKVLDHFTQTRFTDVEVCTELSRHLCPLVGSILASFSVNTNNTVSREAIYWFKEGFEFDAISSRLKLASVFYRVGDINNAELMLTEVENIYTKMVLPLCACYPIKIPRDIMNNLYLSNNLNKSVARCVTFMRCEASVVPQELKQELYRSTVEESNKRPMINKYWMNFAVVDSLPYLYFLQYKVYKNLRRQRDMQKALCSLQRTILAYPNLTHRETAWNLLGQCKEQENQLAAALWCYNTSLEVRPHDNAANFHKARLRLKCILYNILIRGNDSWKSNHKNGDSKSGCSE